MKKITQENSYELINKLIPSCIFLRFKKLSVYKKIKTSAHKYLPSKYVSSWNTIKSGLLKGVKLYVDPSGAWQKEMLNGTYDDFFINYMEKYNVADKIVFDIGAHVGYSALCFAKMVGKGGHVYTFEPNAANIYRIKMITKMNPELSERITLVEKAVAEKTGRVDFIFGKTIEDGSSSGSFVDTADTISEKAAFERSRGFERANVEMTSIDNEVSNNRTNIPYMIKIDIEGAEHLALQGAAVTLKTARPIILLEVHSILNMLNVCKILQTNNYDVNLLKEEPDGRCFLVAEPIRSL
ncbi:MAG: FkbM family methyltransferase [Candidatus Taylorbacteria bacterium]